MVKLSGTCHEGLKGWSIGVGVFVHHRVLDIHGILVHGQAQQGVEAPPLLPLLQVEQVEGHLLRHFRRAESRRQVAG